MSRPTKPGFIATSPLLDSKSACSRRTSANYNLLEEKLFLPSLKDIVDLFGENPGGIQEYLGDIVGLIPDDCNKVEITIKGVSRIFWFPSAHKIYVYTIL